MCDTDHQTFYALVRDHIVQFVSDFSPNRVSDGCAQHNESDTETRDNYIIFTRNIH